MVAFKAIERRVALPVHILKCERVRERIERDGVGMEHLRDENATGGILGEPLDDCHDGELVIKLLEREFARASFFDASHCWRW